MQSIKSKNYNRSAEFEIPVNLLLTMVFCDTGLGGACIYLGSDIALQKYFCKKRSFANGIAVSASSASILFWPLFARYLIDNYGWGGAILLIGKS